MALNTLFDISWLLSLTLHLCFLSIRIMFRPMPIVRSGLVPVRENPHFPQQVAPI